jgi:hypothetical protein
MQEAGRLTGFRSPWHGNLDLTGLRTDDLDAAPTIEGGSLIDRADLSQWVRKRIHRRASEQVDNGNVGSSTNGGCQRGDSRRVA